MYTTVAEAITPMIVTTLLGGTAGYLLRYAWEHRNLHETQHLVRRAELSKLALLDKLNAMQDRITTLERENKELQRSTHATHAPRRTRKPRAAERTDGD